jgi:hypothetical protein
MIWMNWQGTWLQKRTTLRSRNGSNGIVQGTPYSVGFIYGSKQSLINVVDEDQIVVAAGLAVASRSRATIQYRRTVISISPASPAAQRR